MVRTLFRAARAPLLGLAVAALAVAAAPRTSFADGLINLPASKLQLALPDLIITNGYNPGGGLCQPNSYVYYFDVTVANQGALPSGAPAGLALRVENVNNTAWAGVLPISSSIAAGSNATFRIGIPYFWENPSFMTSQPEHRFRAIVDVVNVVNERNESNNVYAPITAPKPTGCPYGV